MTPNEFDNLDLGDQIIHDGRKGLNDIFVVQRRGPFGLTARGCRGLLTVSVEVCDRIELFRKNPTKISDDDIIIVRDDIVTNRRSFSMKSLDRYKQAFQDAYEAVARNCPHELKQLKAKYLPLLEELEKDSQRGTRQ